MKVRQDMRDRRSRIMVAVGLLLTTILVGTIGYRIIEGWTLLDSLYMTMITITTIGYGEPLPLSRAGQIFTLVLIIATIVIIGSALSTVTAFIIEGEFNRYVRGRQMDRRIKQLKSHYILCGCGSTGFYIAEELNRNGSDFVIIEKDETRLENAVEHLGDVAYIQDDATRDDVLKRAGIERAKGLIAAVSDDKDNVFIVLTARSMNADLRIVARLINEENFGKLYRAGANEVVSPNAIGGQRMASVMVRPSVVKFLDEITHGPTPLGFDEIPIDDYPGLIGKTLAESHIGRRTGMLVVAIHSAEGETQFKPSGETMLDPGDVLLVIGTPDQRARLHRLHLE